MITLQSYMEKIHYSKTHVNKQIKSIAKLTQMEPKNAHQIG